MEEQPKQKKSKFKIVPEKTELPKKISIIKFKIRRYADKLTESRDLKELINRIFEKIYIIVTIKELLANSQNLSKILFKEYR